MLKRFLTFRALAKGAGGSGGGSIDSFIDGTITEINSNAARVGAYGVYQRKNLEKVTMPELTRIEQYGFAGCSAIEEFYVPKLKSTGNRAFYSCKNLRSINVESAEGFAIQAFQGCTSLEKIDLPSIKEFSRGAFEDCSALTTVIFRPETMVSVSGGDIFSNTPIANGTGYVYVPSALVDTYKQSGDWTTYANQFRAIEDYPEITGG